MDTPSTIAGIRVHLPSDASSASIEIAAGCPPGDVTEDTLAGAARAHGVALEEPALTALRALADSFQAQPRPIREVFATATPPTPPGPPAIEWEQGLDPDEAVSNRGEDDHVDHYSLSRYVHVQEGQRLGRFVPGEPGTPGRDVLGEPIEPPPPPPDDLLDAEAILVGSDGELTATRTGTLRSNGERYTVDDLLVIDEDIDFGVGNIDAEGALRVNGGVKDNFKIHMTKDVEVRGLVEQASIVCGGILTLASGMTGHERGTLDVGSDVNARYLNGVSARIHGSLRINREIVNCRLIVGGGLEADSASLIGGVAAVTASMRIGVLGSVSETPTVVVLGTAPFFETESAKLLQQRELLQHRVRAAEALIAQLRDRRNPSHAQQEQLMEAGSEANEVAEQLAELDRRLRTLAEDTRKRSAVDLTVVKMIYPRVAFVLDGRKLVTHEAIRGPVSVFQDATHRLVARTGSGHAVPMGHLCNPAA